MDRLTELEQRLARLEAQLLPVERRPPGWVALVAALVGVALAYRGLGLPDHPYQWGLGVLTALLAYHRGWFRRPKEPVGFALVPLNVLLISLVNKLLIGSGVLRPFAWVKAPTLLLTKSDGKWYDVIPSLSMGWEASTLSTWEIDLTRIQTFLLVVTLLAALFRFQPFVSFTAFALLLLALPGTAAHAWTWVFPALLTAGLAFHLQAQKVR